MPLGSNVFAAVLLCSIRFGGTASTWSASHSACPNMAVGEARCGNRAGPKDHLLVQRAAARKHIHKLYENDSALVGTLATCVSSEVTRRRRASSMCSCRRRSGPTCAGDNVRLASATGREIKVMSYNLMGWNAFNKNRWRGQTVMGKIQAWSPDVLGAQEVEKGGYGYHEVKDELTGETRLAHVGGSQFYNADILEQHETEWTNLVRGYWMSIPRFRHKATGIFFLFFNSHWKHGYGMEQARIIVDAVQAARDKYDSPPVILVGDTNQFCRGHELEAWRYLKGEVGSSPVVFEDVLQHDQGKSFSDRYNPDCRVDLILATKGEWTVRQADIDRDGMGAYGSASDHAPLMAELVPIVQQQQMSA